MATMTLTRPSAQEPTGAFGPIYPHEPRVGKLVIFTKSDFESKTRAGVTLFYGPVVIRAKLVEKDNELFLSMPSRKNEAGTWWDHAFIQDHSLAEHFEKLAVRLYQETLRDVAA